MPTDLTEYFSLQIDDSVTANAPNASFDTTLTGMGNDTEIIVSIEALRALKRVGVLLWMQK